MESYKFLISVIIGVLLTKENAAWSGLTMCIQSIANSTNIETSTTDIASQKNHTLQTFKAVCGAKNEFIDCVYKSFNSQQENTVSLLKPLFDVDIVTEAYTGLCNNLTGGMVVSHFDCLTNTSALMPCYAQFNSYYEYLSVFIRLGSGEKKDNIDHATRSFLCTLTKRRIECEVGVLENCSVDLGEVMGTFYERSLPSICRDGGDVGKVI